MIENYVILELSVLNGVSIVDVSNSDEEIRVSSENWISKRMPYYKIYEYPGLTSALDNLSSGFTSSNIIKLLDENGFFVWLDIHKISK